MFQFETAYDGKALAAMARALRKTVRKKHSRRSHMFGWIVILLGLMLSWPVRDGVFAVSFREIVTWLAMAIMVAAMVFEDRLNSYFAGKKLLPGTEKAHSVFSEDAYVSETLVGKTEFTYTSIRALAETGHYFVFLFSNSHAQIYDKRTLQGGSEDAFRTFIQERTGLTIVSV